MKKTLLFLPILFVLAACAAQPTAAPTQDMAGAIQAELTLMAQTQAQIAPTLTPTVTPTPEPAVPALTADLLRGATYRTADWGEFQLTDGIYYRTPPTSQESAEAYTTRMLDTILYGDLDLDGIEDAVVFLATQSGGTGHFIEMAAVLNQNGSASNSSTIYLGDRVVVESGTIQDGVITLNMRVQGPNDGMCCPSQLETWTFHMENNRLVKLS